MTVRVQRARNLKDTEFFGKQDPYVLCYLLPEQEGAERPRTKCVEDGDTDPIWAADHDNVLKLPIPQGDGPRRLAVEIWNENAALDDLIGKLDVAVPGPELMHKPARSKFYSVDSGGDIGLSMSLGDR